MSGSANKFNVGISIAHHEREVGSHQSCVIGIDLGGTKLLAGIANADGDILTSLEQPTHHGEDGSVLDQMVALIATLLANVGRTPGDLLRVVIGVPAAVDPKTGLASLSPNLRLPADRSLANVMTAGLSAQNISCPVVVENDVNLAALAESTIALPQGDDTLAFISFGTGVGMGLVVNGALWRGAFGRAGEIGYLPFGATPHAHAPGSENGLFEDAVGSKGIRARFSSDRQTVTDLFANARQGDGAAQAAIEEIAQNASVGLAAVHALLDPSMTVIGGGIGTQTEFFEALKRHLKPLLPFECRIEPSRFGGQAGMIGAVTLAIQGAVKHFKGLQDVC
ncbi:ROK family protein [Rhizobium oryziradicis]|uniref:ROK family protein n=1 Tax=Rhizobium oryziradicis TaxID=1867956 RepID=UPI000A43C2A0|nr:ROK family protein [Rhizobium oryziradicis]